MTLHQFRQRFIADKARRHGAGVWNNFSMLLDVYDKKLDDLWEQYEFKKKILDADLELQKHAKDIVRTLRPSFRQ